jgi:hypothetical protein
MNRLDQYFEKGRARRREVSNETLRAFLAKHGEQGAPAAGHNHNRRGTMKTLLILGIAAALGSGAIYTISQTDEHYAGKQQRASAESATTSRPMVVETYHCPTEYAIGGGERNSTIAPTALAGLPMLELSDSELGRIGIERIDAPGIVLYQMHGQLERAQATKLVSGSSEGFPDINAVAPPGIDPLPFEYRLVTDDLGRIRRFAFSYEEIDRVLADSIRAVQKRFSYLSNRGKIAEALDSMNQTGMPRWFDELHRRSRSLIDFNRLIPVYIRARSSATATAVGESCRPDMIVWLDPTPELIALLPSDWRQRLAPLKSGTAQELSLANQDRSAAGKTSGRSDDEAHAGNKRSIDPQRKESREESPRSTAASGDVGESLAADSSGPVVHDERYRESALPGATTGEMQMPSEGIDSIDLQPNPVSGVGALRLLMAAERRVAVSLHTVQGARIRLLADDQDLDSGEHRLMLSFAGVPRGLYLLVITTDRGEIVVRRVMVRQE